MTSSDWGAAFAARWGRRDQQGHTGGDVAQGSIDDLRASQRMDPNEASGNQGGPGLPGMDRMKRNDAPAPGRRATIRAADPRPPGRKTGRGKLQPVTSPAPVAES